MTRGAAPKIDLLRLGAPARNSRHQFHRYKVESRKTLKPSQSQALIRDLLDARTYDRNTFTCDCFPEYGIIIHTQSANIELLIDRAKLADVTGGTASWEQSWQQGRFNQIVRVFE
jgi:hypothetical protein